MKNLRLIVSAGLFIAMEVILTRFLSIQTPIVRIGFTFVPLAISSMMFGPVFGGVVAALSDIIGMMIFPSGAFFPGFTFSAFLTGAIYGLFLHKRAKTFLRISLAVITISLFVNLILDTTWLWILTGKGIMAMLPARLIKNLIMIPVQIIIIKAVWNYIIRPLRNIYSYDTI